MGVLLIYRGTGEVLLWKVSLAFRRFLAVFVGWNTHFVWAGFSGCGIETTFSLCWITPRISLVHLWRVLALGLGFRAYSRNLHGKE